MKLVGLPQHCSLESVLPQHCSLESVLPQHFSLESVLPQHCSLESVFVRNQSFQEVLCQVIDHFAEKMWNMMIYKKPVKSQSLRKKLQQHATLTHLFPTHSFSTS